MSYIAVGARSVENQFHRLVASGSDVPVGLKNPTSGDLTVMLNSVAVSYTHLFALPYLLSYFLQTLYGMADLYITGRFCGVDSITAVANGSQVMHMLTAVSYTHLFVIEHFLTGGEHNE